MPTAKATRVRSRSRGKPNTVKPVSNNSGKSMSTHQDKNKTVEPTKIISEWSPIDVKLLLTLFMYRELHKYIGEYTMCIFVTIHFIYKYHCVLSTNICIMGQKGYECIKNHAWSSLFHGTIMFKSLTIFSIIFIICGGAITGLIRAIYHFL
jgi:hypothetical protein